MLNRDKSILVVYLDVTRMNREKGMLFLNEIRNYLDNKFYNTKEINDDSLVVLPIPADRTEIVLLNSKYPDYEQFKNEINEILDEYLNNEKTEEENI